MSGPRPSLRQRADQEQYASAQSLPEPSLNHTHDLFDRQPPHAGPEVVLGSPILDRIALAPQLFQTGADGREVVGGAVTRHPLVNTG
jgi:hypothetical protein